LKMVRRPKFAMRSQDKTDPTDPTATTPTPKLNAFGQVDTNEFEKVDTVPCY